VSAEFASARRAAGSCVVAPIFTIPAIDGDANAYTYPAIGPVLIFKIEVTVFKKMFLLKKKRSTRNQK
jgi:hypothetical protein